jgi:hypothetical protein
VTAPTLLAIAPATLGAVFAFFLIGGITATIVGCAVGLGLGIPLMIVMYGVDPLRAVQAAGIASLMYGMGMAGIAGLSAALGLFFFPIWHLQQPWVEPKPVQVAASTTKPAAPVVVEAAPTTAPVEVAPATAPVIAATAPAAPPEPPKPIWVAAVDPAPPVRFAGNVFLNLEVKTPVKVVTTQVPSPSSG